MVQFAAQELGACSHCSSLVLKARRTEASKTPEQNIVPREQSAAHRGLSHMHNRLTPRMRECASHMLLQATQSMLHLTCSDSESSTLGPKAYAAYAYLICWRAAQRCYERFAVTVKRHSDDQSSKPSSCSTNYHGSPQGCRAVSAFRHMSCT